MANDTTVLDTLKITSWITNNALKARHGWTLVGAQRRKLNAAGLVTSRKVGRQFEHTLTAKAHAKETTSVTVEDQIRTTVTDLLAARNATRVNPATWVPLTKVRDALPNIERATLDAALVSMFRARTVAITPEDNRKALTDADHAAAIVIGGEAKHLVRFRTQEELTR